MTPLTPRPRALTLFLIFLRVGAFTFGGGMAMIPLIEHDVVRRHGLVDRDSFLEIVALAQCAPGPLAANVAVLLGGRLAGAVGALAALAGVVTPAFVVIAFIAANYAAWRRATWVGSMFLGLRPAVAVLVAHAACRFGAAALRDWEARVLFAASAAALIALRLHPTVVVLAATAYALVRSAVGARGGGEEGLRGQGGGGQGSVARGQPAPRGPREGPQATARTGEAENT